MIKGENNIIDQGAVNVIIVGDDNFVGQGRDITLFNCSGVTTTNGASNIMVINTYNKTITESNVSYVNGVKISGVGFIQSPDIVDGGENEARGLFGGSLFSVIDGGLKEVRSTDYKDGTHILEGGFNKI